MNEMLTGQLREVAETWWWVIPAVLALGMLRGRRRTRWRRRSRWRGGGTPEP